MPTAPPPTTNALTCVFICQSPCARPTPVVRSSTTPRRQQPTQHRQKPTLPAPPKRHLSPSARAPPQLHPFSNTLHNLSHRTTSRQTTPPPIFILSQIPCTPPPTAQHQGRPHRPHLHPFPNTLHNLSHRTTSRQTTPPPSSSFPKYPARPTPPHNIRAKHPTHPGKIFPGFKIFCGSSAAFRVAITSTAAPNSLRR